MNVFIALKGNHFLFLFEILLLSYAFTLKSNWRVFISSPLYKFIILSCEYLEWVFYFNIRLTTRSWRRDLGLLSSEWLKEQKIVSKPIRLQGQHAKPLCHDRSYTIAWLPSMYTSRLAFQEVFTTLRLLIIKFMHALFNILHVCLHLIWCSICYFACRQKTSFEHRNGAHTVGTIFIKTVQYIMSKMFYQA